MRVHQQQEVFVVNALATLVHLIDSGAGECDPEAACEFLVPLFVCHFSAVRAEPNNVLNLRAFYFSTLEEFAPPEHRVLLVQRDQPPNKAEGFTIPVLRGPIEPTYFIVLAIGIVVSPLSTPDLITCEQHGNALRKQDRCHEVPLLPCPKLVHFGIVGGTFNSAIPAPVIISPITILLAVGLVVL